MPGAKNRSLKNPKQYEALRGKGMSKERAAKISNAASAARRKHKK
jgi:hypothetical protein